MPKLWDELDTDSTALMGFPSPFFPLLLPHLPGAIPLRSGGACNRRLIRWPRAACQCTLLIWRRVVIQRSVYFLTQRRVLSV